VRARSPELLASVDRVRRHHPTGGVGGVLGTVSRPHGSSEVTYHDQPLYTLKEHGSVGQADGNGYKDSFGSIDFWHAAAVSGSTPAPGLAVGNGYGY
jgi:hypothetical protein